MITVDLLYEKTCPNIEAARQQMLQAFAKLGLLPDWREWDLEDPQTPAHLRAYGSPTIMVQGEDVAGLSANESMNCCRLYTGRDQVLRGTPSVEQIVFALCRI